MHKTVISLAALALVGAGVFAFAQTQSPRPEPDMMSAMPGFSGMAGMRSSAEDRAVFLDARIGAIKAVLKLTADQEKLWEPVEAMIRKAAAFRAQQAEALPVGSAEPGNGGQGYDPIAKLRKDADRMTRRASLMREFADAAAPLYASLSDDQRRRVLVLMQHARASMRGAGWAQQRGVRGGMMGGAAARRARRHDGRR